MVFFSIPPPVYADGLDVVCEIIMLGPRWLVDTASWTLAKIEENSTLKARHPPVRASDKIFLIKFPQIKRQPCGLDLGMVEWTNQSR